MRKPLILLAAALSIPVSVPASANIFSGSAEVVDGDTIDMTGTRIRLVGIDAAESAQQCRRDGQAWDCGADAAAAMRELLSAGPIECSAQGFDSYGNTLATCRNALFDIGHEMVRRGLALPSGDAPYEYAEARDLAKKLKFGMWAGEFDEPAAWRAAHPQVTPQLVRAGTTGSRPASRVRAAAAPAERRYTSAMGCAIKGNHSRYGDYIYHLPGQRYYDTTRPEHLFCTEREAMAAGFRRSKE